MPLQIAWCVPLIFGTLSSPAVSPISNAPGISTFGSDCQPPVTMARAPADRMLPPSRIGLISGWFFHCWKASHGLYSGSL
ncbi:hypothetical protein D9M69_726350 [compost metagenome]